MVKKIGIAAGVIVILASMFIAGMIFGTALLFSGT